MANLYPYSKYPFECLIDSNTYEGILFNNRNKTTSNLFVMYKLCIAMSVIGLIIILIGIILCVVQYKNQIANVFKFIKNKFTKKTLNTENEFILLE